MERAQWLLWLRRWHSELRRWQKCQRRPCTCAQIGRLEEVRGNLIARIAEDEREGWLGEVEGLRVSLAGAEDKLAQITRRAASASVDLPMPTRRREP